MNLDRKTRYRMKRVKLYEIVSYVRGRASVRKYVICSPRSLNSTPLPFTWHYSLHGDRFTSGRHASPSEERREFLAYLTGYEEFVRGKQLTGPVRPIYSSLLTKEVRFTFFMSVYMCLCLSLTAFETQCLTVRNFSENIVSLEPNLT